MRQSTFMLDATGERVFDGFTAGDSWNGWATPLLTFEQAQRIVSAWQEWGWEARYDNAKDVFVFSVNQDFETGKSDEFEEFASIDHEGVKYYGIGAYSWVWEEFDLATTGKA